MVPVFWKQSPAFSVPASSFESCGPKTENATNPARTTTSPGRTRRLRLRGASVTNAIGSCRGGVVDTGGATSDGVMGIPAQATLATHPSPLLIAPVGADGSIAGHGDMEAVTPSRAAASAPGLLGLCGAESIRRSDSAYYSTIVMISSDC